VTEIDVTLMAEIENGPPPCRARRILHLNIKEEMAMKEVGAHCKMPPL
jgi:hypothetical protein